MAFLETLEERIEFIVDTSYCILCNKIANGDITIPNEASMQLHLGTIMKQLGVLFEYSSEDRFRIEMESVQHIQPTQKSKNGTARCDIKLVLSEGKKKCEAFVELKYLKKSENKSSTEAVTDNRYSVYCDIQNLENYNEKNMNCQCYEIVYTDNINHTLIKDTKYCIGNDYTLKAGKYENTKDRFVEINNDYLFKWNIYKEDKEDKCFLKIKVR